MSPSSDSLDHVEIQEWEDHFDGEQEERLLSGHGIEYKTEWHLRTGWVIAGSIIALLLVFSGLVVFTRTFIVDNKAESEALNISGSRDFRRPASDYILDPSWDFKAANIVREYNWNIVDIVGNPDGVYRPMLTINGQFPGPMIECNEGDTIVIEVDNQSVNATSLHFHGIFQNGTNWMDGTTGITQCPIAPGRKFRYEFTVTGQSGTYYYHGHQAVQASDGLYGPLVIHSRDEKNLQQIPYVTDRVVMLQDYYHDISSGLLISALEPGSEASPIPNGALINGMNKRDCSKLSHRLCNNATATSASFDLAANASHRLRFINVGAFAWFQVTVDEHEFALTEADGTDIVPAYETSLMISPAQRYSMIINTNQSTGELFWLRARMVTHCWKEPNLPGAGADEVKAIIHYTSKSHNKDKKEFLAQPASSNWKQHMEVQCKDMNTTSYVPASHEPAPVIADHSYYLRSNLEIGDWRLERGFFNKSTFRPNLQQPTLHRTIEGLSSLNETFTSMSTVDGVNSVSYDLNNDFVIQHSGIKVVDLIIQNFDEGNHPMHLHGHKFWVLGQGHGMFPGYETLGLKAHGQGLSDGQEGRLDNLIRRDVATAEGFGWLALRFVADNPGVWAFHCHMAWHSEAGLLMQFVSRVEEVATWSIPEANRQLCEVEVQELERGACPKDDIWYGSGIGG
ncbi:Diphenol oxidase 1 [Hyphodiscus hymeniophilus]|uniref:Diphenol oxidase 1 n=1 Tax=Hyphodiscus hymeniophilus TaxID=353542 RepID=A0A9P7AW03_9HELO|nr:Diphenol oxidase 1 [Hyphodiscus hymeniophilus]